MLKLCRTLTIPNGQKIHKGLFPNPRCLNASTSFEWVAKVCIEKLSTLKGRIKVHGPITVQGGKEIKN